MKAKIYQLVTRAGLFLIVVLMSFACDKRSSMADVVHKLTMGNGGVGGYGGTMQSSSPIQWNGSGSGSDGFGNSVNATWSIRSDRGSLHAKLTKESFGTSFPHADIAGATAEFTIDDLVFSGSSGNIATSLVLDLGGTYSWDDGEGAYGFVRVETFLFGPGGNYGYSGDASQFGNTGLLSSWTYPQGEIWWGIPSVALNVPNTLTVRLTALATGGDNASGDGYAFSWSDFFGSLTFNSDGPVFANLPDGVTVNSAQGGIVDNQYLGPSIPEPSSLLICGNLLVFVTLMHRRRTSVKSAG